MSNLLMIQKSARLDGFSFPMAIFIQMPFPRWKGGYIASQKFVKNEANYLAVFAFETVSLEIIIVTSRGFGHGQSRRRV